LNEQAIKVGMKKVKVIQTFKKLSPVV